MIGSNDRQLKMLSPLRNNQNLLENLRKNNTKLAQMSSIADFLDYTLSRLKNKKPNQRNLKPLDNNVLLRFQQQLASQMRNFQKRNDAPSLDHSLT